MLRRLRLIQYILYGGSTLICFICNLAVSHTLDWFWVVLTSELLCASFTLLPVLVERQRGLITLGASTFFLELLLLTCALFTGTPDWFPVAAMGNLLGVSVIFLPFLLRKLPLPHPLVNQKGLLYFGINTILLLLLMLSVDCYGSDHWFPLPGLPITLYCLLLPWGCFLFLRYLPWNGWFRAACCLTLTGLMQVFSNGLTNWFISLSGYASATSHLYLFPHFDFSNWRDMETCNGNVTMIVGFALGTAALLCIGIGIQRALNRRT